MPQQNRDAIQDTVLKIRRHIEAMPNEDRGPTPEEKDIIIGCVLVVASLAISLDRIADAAEQIAQALEDKHKIHTPQQAEQPACHICGAATPVPHCDSSQCPFPCPVCNELGHRHSCDKPSCPKFPF